MEVQELDQETLEEQWRKIALGLASDQEKIDAAVLTGQRGDRKYVPRLLLLLGDPDGEVRYYALQTLVIDLKQFDKAVEERSWKALCEDQDEDVRSMAATCLGKIYFNSRSRSVFIRLLDQLKAPGQPDSAKGLIYSALFKVAGRPPSEWPGLLSPRKVFERSDIDWNKVAWLEDQMEET
jgi:hypothetical protein